MRAPRSPANDTKRLKIFKTAVLIQNTSITGSSPLSGRFKMETFLGSDYVDKKAILK